MASLGEQSCFGIGFGGIKLGKTTDAVMSFPNAVFIAAPGALKPSLSVAGFEPKPIHDATSLDQITEIITAAGKHGRDAVVVDDFTLYVQREVARLSQSGTGGYDLWGAIYRKILHMRDASRRSGVHVWFTLHERQPETVNGKVYPGTVMLPGKQLPFDVPAAVDLLLRAQPMGDGFGNPIGWPVVYRCNPNDPTWRTGDRHSVTPDMSPMNVGEILRLYARENKLHAFAPKRLFPWQEALVEKGAKVLLDQDAVTGDAKSRTILKAFAEAVAKHATEERHVLWTVRDAWDRAVLTVALKANRSKLYF